MATGALDPSVQAVFDRLPVGIAVIFLEGESIYLNERYVAMFGYRPTHIDEWWPAAYPDPAYRQEVMERWTARVEAAIAADGAVEPDAYRVTCADGTEKWTEILGVVLDDKLYVVLRDITEARQQQAALRAEASFRDAIIDAAADGICVCHAVDEFPHVRFTVWSQRMVAITGYTMAEINDQGWYQTLYPDPEVRDRAVARMDRMRDGDNLRAEEWPIRRKDGVTCQLAISTSVILGEGGTAHVLGLMQDRTERHRMEAERRKLEGRMLNAQKLESLGLLAGGIAHDFNNLLVAILGHTELVLDDLADDSPVRAGVLDIRQAAERASELTNQMLAYAGKGSFVVGPMDLNGVVDEMAKLLRRTALRHTSLDVRLARHLPTVEGDASQLRQVVLNLMTNAGEATAEGGRLLLETNIVDVDDAVAQQLEPVGAVVPGRYVRLQVRDSGVGMTVETRARIFEPFYSTKTSGRGLGLAAVLGIIRAHEGGLRLTTAPGEGATFEVFLPCQEGQMAAGPSVEPPLPEIGQGRILVIDDEEQVRRVARAMLERRGFTVVEAASGEGGLELFANGAFDAVILDLSMPGLGGLDVLEALRAQVPRVPVLLVSGYAEEVVPVELTGPTGFLQKPFTISSLLRELREVLRPEA